jgi:hypothetical protein
MNTDILMSSLREMVRAECDMLRGELIGSQLGANMKDAAQEQYSRHETVVREQLQKLADEASYFRRQRELHSRRSAP